MEDRAPSILIVARRDADADTMGGLLTLAFHVATMPFFRAKDLGEALGILSVPFRGAPPERAFHPAWWALLGTLAAGHALSRYDPWPRWWRRPPEWVFAAGLGLVAALLLGLGAPLAEPFVYFRF